MDDGLSTNPFPNLKHLWEFSQLEPVEVLYPYDLSTDSSVKSSDISDSDESLDSDLEPFPSYTPNPNNNGSHSNTLASQNKDARRKYKSAKKPKDNKMTTDQISWLMHLYIRSTKRYYAPYQISVTKF